jgi:hypothetical protein
VLERHPEAMSPEPLLGYVWLDPPGKVLIHAPEHHLEFADQSASVTGDRTARLPGISQ